MTQQTTIQSPWVSERLACDQPDWLRQAREAAYTQFAEMSVPKLEKTDLRRRNFDLGAPPKSAGTPSAKVQALLEDLAGAAFVFVRDGVPVRTHVPDELTAQGVVVMDLAAAVAARPDVVQKHLGSVVQPQESKWAALNAAAWTAGAFVFVPRGVSAACPVVFVHESSSASTGCAIRSLVVAEADTALSYTEIWLVDGSPAEQTVHTEVLEVAAGAAAHLWLGIANEARRGPTYFRTKRARLENDAQVEWVSSDVGDGFSVALLESELVGTGSKSTLQGIGVGRGRQHLDFTASMLHRGRYTESDIRLHGALRERANSVYRSSTHIFRNAVAAGSEQHDRMLMLDPAARADAIPMLLIDENDVQRCGHAASVGRIDEGQLYYLQSRGIPYAEARRMIVWGYLEPTVEVFPEGAVREWVRRQIDEELVE
ncbi:MAG: SufD family Fe-S cluster assembly protein [Alicyclobacillus sp.]|nr:SufD family Fe-S cluster assembly protein [Alicyclobacillus sp.]